MTRAPSRHALTFVATTVLLDVIGFGLILPVLPRLLVQLTGKGLDQAAIDGGWLAFVYAAMQFVCAPILGNLSDRFGRRPVLLVAIAVFGLDYLVMAFAPTYGWLFLGRVLSGMTGASFTPAYAYVVDISPPEKRAQSFGMLSSAFGFGFILGPALGGLLGGLGPRAPFFAAAALSLANFVYGVIVLPESLPPERRRPFDIRRANPLGTLLQVRRYPAVLGVLGALFLWMLGHQVMPSTWAFYAQYRFGWSAATIGLSLAVAGTVMAVSPAVLLPALVSRIGERRTALTGIAIACVGYLGYATATTTAVMLAWLATWFFGAIVMPSTNALLTHRVPPNAQGELQGAVASLYSLASIAGPPLMTHLFGYFSSARASVRIPGAAFLAAAALAATAFVIYWNTTREPVGAGVLAGSGAAESSR
jgi:DHA1 family tetracycline resistance protein-like MFS transporter